MTTLKINHLSKKFGRHEILQDVTFSLNEHKIYGLLGRNGVGKSTLLNIITNRNFPTNGDVLMDNQSINNNSTALKRMYLMSESNMYPKQTKIKDMFIMADEGFGNFDYELAGHFLQSFGIKVDDKLANLSTGLTTAAKLTVALAVSADFIFLDEPTLGLDANHRELFYRELMKTFDKRPRTFVLSTHLISEVQSLVENVLILNDTKLIQDTSVDDLLANAYAISGPSDVVDQFCQGFNVLDQETISKIKIAYIVQPLSEDREIPDQIKIDHLDLQKAFTVLTNGEGE